MENELVGFENEVIRKVATYADVVYQYVKGKSPEAIAAEFEIDVKKVLGVIARAEEAGHLKLTLDQLVAKGATPDGAEPRTASVQLNPAQPAPAAQSTDAAQSDPGVPTTPTTTPETPTQPQTTTPTDPTQPSTGNQEV